MKFKNIEDVWAYAKNKLVNAQISSIQKTGSSKFFDITIPKVMVKKDPEGLSKRDLDYTITETAGEIECILEQTGDVSTIVDSGDFFDNISAWCGINESQEPMNQNALIAIEDSDINGFDKMLICDFYGTRAEFESKLKKLGKPFKLNVMPSEEAEIHVKSADVTRFKEFIQTIHEAETGHNMAFMESFEIKGRPVPESLKSDFSQKEKDLINTTVGNTWYQITQRSKVFKDAYALVKKSKQISKTVLDGFDYVVYEAPKGTKFIYLSDGYGAEALIFGDRKINESVAQDKYQEFFKEKLKKYNVSSPAELTQEDRSKFFQEIKDEWKGVNESFLEGGYEILTQSEFLSDFAGTGNFGSYALQMMYNPRLLVKCPSTNENYPKIRAYVETMKPVPSNEYDKTIFCYRQTDSNLIIIYNDNIYWSYNTGTNLVLLNESELIQGTGKVYDTLADTGTLSDNAVVEQIKALCGTMSELSRDPSFNAIKMYRECEDKYNCLVDELKKRGLNL